MGSVKDLQIIEKANAKKVGKARFVFSDRYSVFDWGEMPDQIHHKGTAIAILGAYFFEKLKELDIPTHYLGLVEDNEAKPLSKLKGPSNTMEVALVQVLKPTVREDQYDYSIYQNATGNILIPLELIYRNILPPGSSVFKRLKTGQIQPKDLGLDKMPVPNQRLNPPIVDASTKLEVTDRYLSWEEAAQISGLSDQELEKIKQIIHTVNQLITKEFSKIGLINEDGKIELGFDANRNPMVVDVLGTLDECRFTYDGFPVSKEVTRVYYRTSDWFQAVEEAKKKDRQNWKKICTLQPEPLPTRLAQLISQIYGACTNEITGREWFKDTPPLKEIIKEIRESYQLSS